MKDDKEEGSTWIFQPYLLIDNLNNKEDSYWRNVLRRLGDCISNTPCEPFPCVSYTCFFFSNLEFIPDYSIAFD